VSRVAISPDGQLILGQDQKGRVLAWDRLMGLAVPPDKNGPLPDQTEARDPALDLLVRAEGITVMVRPLRPRAPPEDVAERGSAPSRHDALAAASEKAGNWLAAAFHLERQYRLQPFSPGVRNRLLSALERSPSSLGSRVVHQRLVAFDLARLAGAVALPGGGATAPTLAAMGEAIQGPAPLPELAPAPDGPPRMPKAD
jgi:hypothetical protein